MPDKGYTPKQLADELGYSLGYVYLKIHKKELAVHKYGRGPNSVRIFADDNKELFAQRRAFMAGEKPTAQAST